MIAFRCIVLAAVLLLGACSKEPQPAASAQQSAASTAVIDWIRPSSAADIDGVFETARATRRPVFLFWSATWCPPCNHVKATVFSRPDFVDKSRAFLAVYADGDTPGGQGLGKRFKVSGYPTMVLLNADGAEVTRLAGSVDAARYMQLLEVGLAGGTTASDALAAALAGRKLDAQHWRLLAYHAWETDERQLVSEAEAPSVLMTLATRCPPSEREAAARLVLQALSAAVSAKPGAAPVLDKADARGSVMSLLAQPDLVREHLDLFSHAADDIVGGLTEPGTPQRNELAGAWRAALDRVSADASLGNAARVWVTTGKVNLARLEQQPLPEALLADVRATAARADRETSSLDERQSVITSAGGMLSRAGLHDEAADLMRAEIPRSHSPYYYMLGLAVNERRRGTAAGNAAALDWARQAYEASTGPATRIEWGAAYLRYLIDLAPADADLIEHTALRVVGELQPDPGAYAGRSQRILQRTSERLVKWSEGRHNERLRRIHAAIVPRCELAADKAERASCEGLFLPPKSS